jgi:hypothetical protein
MENKKYIPALGYDFLTAYYDLAIKITMPEKSSEGFWWKKLTRKKMNIF